VAASVQNMANRAVLKQVNVKHAANLLLVALDDPGKSTNASNDATF
jgi:hypothetical protein